MQRLETTFQSNFIELYYTLDFALDIKDHDKLRASYQTIMALANQTPFSDLPYKLFQLTYSPDPFTRILASGALSIHFELDKKHPVHDLTQALDTAIRQYRGDPDQLHAYLTTLVLDSPDLATLLRRMEADLSTLPDEMRFALTTVVVKCLPETK